MFETFQPRGGRTTTDTAAVRDERKKFLPLSARLRRPTGEQSSDILEFEQTLASLAGPETILQDPTLEFVATRPNPALASAPMPASSLRVDAPPWDWSIRQRIRIASTKPLKWLAMGAPPASERGKQEELSNLLSELASYHFEPIRKAPSLSSASDTDADRDFERWCSAFHQLFYALRSGKADFFYLLGMHQILFSRGRDDSIHAVVSKSSYQFRNFLRSRGLLIPSMGDEKPPVAMADEEKGLSDTMEALNKFEAARPGSTRVVAESKMFENDGTVLSLLHFSGRKDVQTFFDIFLELCTTKRRESLPTLISPQPFLHGTWEQLSVSKCTTASRAGSRDPLHSIDLEGCVLPNHVVKLCQILQATQQGDGFDMKLWANSNTTNFNAPAALPPACDEQTVAPLNSHKDLRAELFRTHTIEVLRILPSVRSITCQNNEKQQQSSRTSGSTSASFVLGVGPPWTAVAAAAAAAGGGGAATAVT